MAFEYLADVPLERAKTDYLEILIQNGMAPRPETIPVSSAAGRVTAAPVYAHKCSPHYNASAMDGVALEAKLTSEACEAAPVCLAAGQYSRVNTGDPIPEGCDCVVMIEDVTDSGDGGIMICSVTVPWQHIRQIGEDINTGEMILPSFSLITPAALGAMVAGGVSDVTVVKRPIAGIIQAGDVPDCSSVIFAAMLRDWGAEPISYPVAGSDFEIIRVAIEKALTCCDAVIVSTGTPSGGCGEVAKAAAPDGGSEIAKAAAPSGGGEIAKAAVPSGGEIANDVTPSGGDCAAAAIRAAGTILYHGLAIKPGKPAILGYSGTKPVLGIPGYPVSGIIVIELILRPIIEYLCHKTPEPCRYAEAVLSKTVSSAPEYREFIRVRMGYVENRLIASPLNRGSGVVTSFMKADGIVEVPQGSQGYDSGAKVSVRLLKPESELRRSLVAIGSHDPLLDELSDILRVKYGDISMGSAHVGSMGGLIAVRRGEAHLAGTHLLDERTGEYNVPFVRKYFPKGKARLVECVKRTQGFIVQKGNPKGITGVADLARDGIRYVNRQKGSGTRILLDYMCRDGCVDTSEIYGYNREEYTHTSVAALITADSADAGLGILSVAKLYGLDFIPVCEEQYDLLIPDHAWELPMMQKLLEALKSDEFRQRLEAMGGYAIGSPGEVRFITEVFD